jgi:uncharacterized glyoxalase superfamily protein PhnB
MSDPVKLLSVAPIFQVTNLERAIDFYTRAMGFELGWTAGKPADRASYCRDAVEITVEVERVPARGQAYLQVSGINAYFESVVAAGATVKLPLGDRPYGMRDCRLVDPDGNELHIGEPLVRG